MFEIPQTEDTTVPMIDFGWGGKPVFQLPVLGSKGVPTGVMSAWSMFYSLLEQGRTLSERDVSSAWAYFIQVLIDCYPDAARHLARLTENQLTSVITHWVQQSSGYDPKA